MTAQEFATHIHSVKRLGDGFKGLCPGHDDQRSSLSFRDGEKGVVVKCFAGCTVESITAALGVAVTDLFTENGNGHAPTLPPPSIVVARYPYHSEDGTLLYEVERRLPKDFRPRQPDGKGGWIWNLTKPEVRRVLYRLPHLSSGNGTAYIVEGEQDADRLVALGLPATTSNGGANNWRDEYGDQLIAAGITRVVILPDCDAAGEGYAVAAATSCLNRGLSVKMVRLPGLRDKGDVSDWLNAGHTLSELSTLVRETPLATRETLTAPTASPPHELLLTQDGDGYRCEWPGDGVGLSLTHLTESRSGLHAEVTVFRLSSTREQVNRLQRTTLNLSSSTARAALAKILGTMAQGKGIEWVSLLDAASVGVADAVRTPTPVVDLATIEPQHHAERYAVDPLLSLHETNILYGDGDSGKSYVALAMGMAITGQPGNRLALPSPLQALLAGRVLYLDYETHAGALTTRLHALGLGGDLWPLPSIHYRAAHRPLALDLANIRADIQRFGAQLLIVDSMAPACGGKPEDSDVSLAFMMALRSLGPITRLVLCHISKQDVEKRRTKIFGSVFTRNLARQCWEARASRPSPHQLLVGLFPDKYNDGPRATPFGVMLTWQDQRCTLTPGNVLDDPDLSPSANPNDRIRDALKAGPLTMADLSREVGIPPHDLKKRLPTMRSVCRVGDGTGKAERWGLAAHYAHEGGMYNE